jgi:hypothetical protein
VTLIFVGYVFVSAIAVTVSPDFVVVCEISSNMTAKEVKGFARQLMEIKEKS